MVKGLVKFRGEFRKQSSIAIIAAFGFLIALSWRDFVSAIVNQIVANMGATQSAHVFKLIAAIIVTVISIVGIMFASKLNVAQEEKTEDEPKKKAKKK